MVLYSKILDQKGLVNSLEGNISIYDRENDLLYVTPTSTRKEFLKPEDIAIMKANIDTTRVQIKAAGGISTVADAEAFLKAGCSRLGISRTQAMFDEIDAASK